MLHNKQLFNKAPFQSTKYRKKELCVDDKVREIIGDVHCPICSKCVYISTNKTTRFYDCKKCKACCHVLNFPFRDHKPTFMLFGGFIVYTSCDYDRPSPFLKKFLRQSQPGTSEPVPKKRTNRVQIWNKGMSFPLVDDLSGNFIFQFVLFNFNLQLTAQI